MRLASRALVVVGVVLLIICVLASVSIIDRRQAASVPNHLSVSVESGQVLNVTFIGDSLDFGLYASSPYKRFHSLLVDDWRKDAGSVMDSPESPIGGTTTRALSNPDLPKNQQLYVIELGTNDVAQLSYLVFRRNYETLLDRVKASSPDAALLCVGIWRPRGFPNGDRFDTIIRDSCTSRGGVFRAVRDLFDDNRLRGPAGIETQDGQTDDFHPNDDGHAAIAKLLSGAVEIRRP